MKYLTISVVILAALPFDVTSGFSISPKTKKEGDGRIINGIDAQRYDFPYLVSFQESDGDHLCGGVILTQTWILTAAHCLVGRTEAQCRVAAGMLIQKENHTDVQIRQVAQFIFHPNFPGEKYPPSSDIALLLLSKALDWTSAVQPIAIPNFNQEFTGNAVTAGWGYLNSALPVVSPKLQRIQLLIISYQQCVDDFIDLVGTIGSLNQNMICGRGVPTGTESFCNGDSGGPLLQGGYLIGINSWIADPCGTKNVPSVYTKVSKYTDFIRKYVPGV